MLLAAAGDRDFAHLIARDPEGNIVAVRRVPPEHPIRALRAFKAEHEGFDVERFRPAPWLRPLLATMALAGLRIGEARGLAWLRVKEGALEVREGVDRYNERGSVKTVAALRTVPIGPQLGAILGNWRATQPSGDPEADRQGTGRVDLVFPSETGTPLGYPNVANRQLAPLQVALGIVDASGSPLWTAHSFRHFAVSLWIDEGASLKQVAEWAGHESPEFTQRVYGHLFARDRTDCRAITAGELSVLGSVPATDQL